MNDPEQKRVPYWEAVGWGIGGFAENMMANGVVVLALSIYNIGMGVSAVWIGWALSIPRIFDTIANPLMGNWSDNTRTRLGRRHPWIIAGVFTTALTYFLIWRPPLAWNTEGKFVWFAIFTTIFFIGYDFYAISYNALGIELTDGYNERTRIQSFRSFFILISNAGMAWLYKLCFVPWFAGPPGTKIRPEVIGVRNVGTLFAVMIVVMGLLPVLACRDKPKGMAQKKVPILESIRLTASNRVFRILLGISTMSWFGLVICGPLGTYLLIFYVCHGDKSFAGTLTGVAGTVGALAGLLALPVIRWLANVFGKRSALFAGQFCVALGAVCSWFFFDPLHPWLALWSLTIQGIGVAFFVLLGNSILGDICDLDELKTGLRREGAYNGTSSLVNKFAIAFGTLFSGYLITFSGFHGGDSPTPATVRIWRLMYVSGPLFFAGVGASLTMLFPLTKRYAAEVRRKLEERAREGHQVLDSARIEPVESAEG